MGRGRERWGKVESNREAWARWGESDREAWRAMERGSGRWGGVEGGGEG